MTPELWAHLMRQLESLDSKVDLLMDFRSKALGMMLLASVAGGGFVTLVLTVMKH